MERPPNVKLLRNAPLEHGNKIVVRVQICIGMKLAATALTTDGSMISATRQQLGRAIKRASLIYQLNRVLNFCASSGSALKGSACIADFDRKGPITEVLNLDGIMSGMDGITARREV